MKDQKEDQAQDTPFMVTGNSTGGYEYSAPVVYDRSTGEYEFEILQEKKTGELSREVYLAPDGQTPPLRAGSPCEDDDDVGSTLLIDKADIEITVSPEKLSLAEREKMSAAAQERNKTQSNRSPKSANTAAALALTMAIASTAIVFIFLAATKHDPAIAANEPMPEDTGGIPKLSKPAFEIEPAAGPPAAPSQRVVYALGYAPFTAAPQGGLKDKSHVISFHGFSDEKIGELEAQNCAEISLEGVKVSDHNLQKLSKLKNLYMLDLQHAHGFSPRGLFAFKRTALKRLHLDGTGISDKWTALLESLPVEFLSVMGNKLSDESLITLAKSRTLKFLKFEADPSAKINNALNAAGWMRLPEGNERAFNCYRESVNTERH
ncbi:MAG: hypothetical protein IT342_11085 [Candidatus Melainabacteria bacterium]|nr:hypothetical protein [Candidatus Melainabacteria bacterium]